MSRTTSAAFAGTPPTPATWNTVACPPATSVFASTRVGVTGVYVSAVKSAGAPASELFLPPWQMSLQVALADGTRGGVGEAVGVV
jgi:hypothetical protein